MKFQLPVNENYTGLKSNWECEKLLRITCFNNNFIYIIIYIIILINFIRESIFEGNNLMYACKEVFFTVLLNCYLFYKG